MTDRYNYLVVGLERDMRSDEAANLITAISLLRGVLKVVPHEAGGSDSWLADERAKDELRDRLWAVLFPKKGDST